MGVREPRAARRRQRRGLLEKQTWIVGGYRSLLVSHDAGTTWAQSDALLPGRIESFTVIDANHLSAIVAVYPCGNGDCYLPQELWVSDDAGQTWRDATP